MVFIVNQDVKNEFEDLKKLSSMLKSKSEFDVPYPFEKVEEWEKSNRVKIPDMYKSWLLLTSYARIMDGRIELFFPEIVNSDKEDVYIGSIGYGTDDLYFSKNTGAFYVVLLSKVITQLGAEPNINRNTIERLNPVDFAFLVDFLHEINHQIIKKIPLHCPNCNSDYWGEFEELGEA